MAKPRARGGSGKGRRESPPPVVRISPAARFIGGQLWTFVLVGGLVAGLSGWQIAEKLQIETAIPTGLWAAFVVGAAVLALPALGFLALGDQIGALRRMYARIEYGDSLARQLEK